MTPLDGWSQVIAELLLTEVVMFECKGCQALRSENEHLRGLVNRLLDKLAGPELPKDTQEPELASPLPFEEIQHENGEIEEIHRYGV